MKTRPVCLTIAGSDSGGGAGIQADLKTFESIGVFGTSAITCLTAQNPDGVSGILEVSAEMLELQARAVLDFFPVKAVKSGMLFSTEIIQKLVTLQKNYNFDLILDPVMIATSGAKLLQDSAIEALRDELIPLSKLVTPNVDEVSLLLNKKFESGEELKSATIEFFERYKTPVLIKGGHLPENNLVTDYFFDGKISFSLESEYISGRSTHGTGCTYSSAIASYFALGYSVEEAIHKAKSFLHSSILNSYSVGKISTLNHSPFTEGP
ncbi:MAG: bifunctional hydroxymethylpyrimidine kinase/phosphomethylpyrimidine kinase [Leptospiraceae bacterium]|nr:bifunctional hydroxymethylpyrimidine kinase/phosphomethylpyrimidine kinase [Leptospiraceae bacterium]MCP5512307.1 bifunctional hydroxymethylpyrimidine kinase/phosphomethylpyrimidine kinase [Leptospiraceae bacterium]